MKKPLSLIKATEQVVAESGFRNIGLLASPNTIKSKLHRQLFKNHKVITLSRTGQDDTSSIIHSVIGGANDQLPVLLAQINELSNQGAEIVVLGCTELSVINHQAQFKNVIDPLDVICKKIMEHKV